MGKKAKKNKLYSSHPMNPWGDEAEEEFNDLSRPRKEHYHSNWKPHQDAVYWIHLANPQEKRLKFGIQLTLIMFKIQCRPIASKKWYAKEEKELYIRDSTSRPAPKTILKDVISSKHQQSQQDTLRSLEKPVAEQHQGICITDSKGSTGRPVAEKENPFKVDLRIQGIPQDAVLEDQGRMTQGESSQPHRVPELIKITILSSQ